MTLTKQTFSIRQTAETLVPDSLGRTSYSLTIGIIILMTSIISLLLSKLPQVVPLYFTLPWGEARLAPKLMLYTLPGLMVLFMILNLSVGRALRHLSSLLPKVLAVATATVALMMLIAIMGIIQSLIL